MQRLLTLAFNICLMKRGLVHRNDPLCEMVARKVEMLSGMNNSRISRRFGG